VAVLAAAWLREVVCELEVVSVMTVAPEIWDGVVGEA
jgi:hypothetical protein